MPYISTEEVAIVRHNLKKEFPSVKFSVRREHYSSLRVTVVSSLYDLSDLLANYRSGYAQLNQFYPDRYSEFKCGTFIKRLIAVCTAGVRTVSEDYDYGSIPNHYVSINVGSWDRPYLQIK